MGRPPKSEDDLTVPIRLEKKYVDMLDSYIEREVQKSLILHNKPFTTIIRTANARRNYLGQIIEDKLGFEARHQDEIKIIVPAGGHAEDFKEVADWLQEQGARLEAEAPEPVKIALKHNKELLEWWKRNAPLRKGLTIHKGPQEEVNNTQRPPGWADTGKVTPRLLTISEAAKQLGVPPGSLRTAAEEHGFIVRMGRAVRIDPQNLPELIKSCQDQKQALASTKIQQPASMSSETPAAHNNQRALETAERLKRRSPGTSRNVTGQQAQIRPIK